MSLIRYVQMHHLRLGSPLTGISGGPEWLRTTLSSAVRQTVQSVFEVAVSNRCDFLLLTGRLTENPDDQESVLTWLAPQIENCRRNGVKLGMSVETPQEFSVAQRLGAIPLRPEEGLVVSRTPDHVSYDQRAPIQPCQFQVVCQNRVDSRQTSLPVDALTPSILISTSTDGILPAAGRQYSSPLQHHSDPLQLRLLATHSRRTPVHSPDSAGRLTSSKSSDSNSSSTLNQIHQPSSEGVISIECGSPQAISPMETGAHGCVLVEVDTAQRLVTSRMCAVDRVRYLCETIQCPAGTNILQAVQLLADRSRQLSSHAGRTCVVDWILDGRLEISSVNPGACAENELLARLRNVVQSGHLGAWPRRIRFAQTSTVTISPESSSVAEEYVQMLNCRYGRNTGSADPVTGPRTTALSNADAVLGLELLARVA